MVEQATVQDIEYYLAHMDLQTKQSEQDKARTERQQAAESRARKSGRAKGRR